MSPESISTNATGALYCVVFCRSQRTTWKEKLTPSPLIRNHTSEEFFVRLALVNQQNAIIIYDYIVAQKNELNIKGSTVGGIIKKLVWLSSYLQHKSFPETSSHMSTNSLIQFRLPSIIPITVFISVLLSFCSFF